MLFGKEGGRENFLVGLRHFPSGPTQNLSLLNEEKTKWGVFDGEMTKLLAFLFYFLFSFMVSWALPSLFIYLLFLYIFSFRFLGRGDFFFFFV